MFPTPSAQRLQHGLPGYLILFAPHAFAPQRQYTAQRPAFATGVPPDICAFHRYTRNSSLPYCTLVCPYPLQYTGLSPGLSQQTRQTAYKLFTPNNSGQRSRPTYYRGCWHVVSRRFLSSYRQPTHQGAGLLHWRKRFTTRRPPSLTRRRCIRLAPIVQNPPLLPPAGVWAVSQSQCDRPPSQAGYPSPPW